MLSSLECLPPCSTFSGYSKPQSNVTSSRQLQTYIYEFRLASLLYLPPKQPIKGKEHFRLISSPPLHCLSVSCLGHLLGVCRVKPHWHLDTTAGGQSLWAGRMSQFAEPVFGQAAIKDLWRNPRNPEGQCEFSLNDSCPYASRLRTCFTSAAMELVCLGSLRAGTGRGFTFGSIFPSCPTSQMSGASSTQTQECFLFGPSRFLKQLQLQPDPLNQKQGP